MYIYINKNTIYDILLISNNIYYQQYHLETNDYLLVLTKHLANLVSQEPKLSSYALLT